MKVFSLAFLIFGCFFGAGFVSGREISTYFSISGKYSILAIIFAGIIFFLLVYLFLWLSKFSDSFPKFIIRYFGAKGQIINFLFLLCLFIITSSMFAGSVAIADYLNVKSIIVLAITLILAYFVMLGNINSLTKINSIFTPILIIIMLVVCGIPTVGDLGEGNCILALISGGNYVLINIVTLGLFLLEIGNQYSNKEKLLSAIIASVIVVILMLVVNFSIIDNNLINDAMPILSLAQFRNNSLGLITAGAIWFGLFTTLLSCILLLCNSVDKYINNYKFTLFIVLFSSACCSSFGFGFIVEYIYSIIGLIGLIMVIAIVKKERKTFVQAFRKN